MEPLIASIGLWEVIGEDSCGAAFEGYGEVLVKGDGATAGVDKATEGLEAETFGN